MRIEANIDATVGRRAMQAVSSSPSVICVKVSLPDKHPNHSRMIGNPLPVILRPEHLICLDTQSLQSLIKHLESAAKVSLHWALVHSWTLCAPVVTVHGPAGFLEMVNLGGWSFVLVGAGGGAAWLGCRGAGCHRSDIPVQISR